MTTKSEYSYDPYGRVTKIAGSGPDADFQYVGYYMHARSGLNLTRTRAYSASLGRFINRDPIAERGGTNLYGYVAGDPINLRDPSGTFWGRPGGNGGGNGGGGDGGRNGCQGKKGDPKDGWLPFPFPQWDPKHGWLPFPIFQGDPKDGWLHTPRYDGSLKDGWIYTPIPEGSPLDGVHTNKGEGLGEPGGKGGNPGTPPEGSPQFPPYTGPTPRGGDAGVNQPGVYGGGEPFVPGGANNPPIYPNPSDPGAQQTLIDFLHNFFGRR